MQDPLVTRSGPNLLAQALEDTVTEIVSITRYAPGLTENGGGYTHCASWAIAAAAKGTDAEPSRSTVSCRAGIQDLPSRRSPTFRLDA